eukprot:gene4521-6386_t
MKKHSGVIQQEKDIQKMIDRNDIPGLKRLLMGRGEGRLVMSASSQFEMDEWISHLLECAGHSHHYNSENSIYLKQQKNEEKLDISGPEETSVIMTGWAEKAARTHVGVIKAWRRRYFVLFGKTLIYYTKPRNGKKKGSIRVRGGLVRLLSSHEVNGKPFCFCLEEGRDLSQLSDDLLDEARRAVRYAKIQEIEKHLKHGIRIKSLELLLRSIQEASLLQVLLDFDLMSEAKALITQLQDYYLKRNIFDMAWHNGVDSYSHAYGGEESFINTLTDYHNPHLSALLYHAKKNHLDPQLPSYSILLTLARSTTELHGVIYHTRNAILDHNPLVFKKHYKTICKLVQNMSALSSKIRLHLMPVLLEHCVYTSLKLIAFGCSSSGAVFKLLKHGFGHLKLFRIESEAQDLLKLILNINSVRVNTPGISPAASPTSSFYVSNDGTRLPLNSSNSSSYDGFDMRAAGTLSPSSNLADIKRTRNLKTYLDEMKNNSFYEDKYNILKCPLLRVHATHKKPVGLFSSLNFSFGNNGPTSPSHVNGTSEVVSFTTTAITKSLLKHDALQSQPHQHTLTEAELDALCVESFHIIQAIMMDKTVASLPRPSRKPNDHRILIPHVKSGIFGVLKGDYLSVIGDLVSAGSSRFTSLADELIIQLAKQLTNNPSSESTQRGWLLMTLFAHILQPSIHAQPYILNFLASALQKFEYEWFLMSNHYKQHSTTHHEQPDQGVTEVELLIKRNLVKLSSYALKVFSNMIIEENSTEMKQRRQTALFSTVPLPNTQQATIETNSYRYFHKHINNSMISHIFEQQSIEIEILILSGSIFRTTIPYGQIDTAYSLLEILYDRLVESIDEQDKDRINMIANESSNYSDILSLGSLSHVIHSSMQHEHDSEHANKAWSDIDHYEDRLHSPVRVKNNHTKSKSDRIMSLFRGFAFYSVHADDFNNDNSPPDLDLKRLAVQPELSQLVQWNDDLQWDLLLHAHAEGSGEDANVENIMTEEMTNHSKFKLCNMLILRRCIGSNSEGFVKPFELFGDEVAEEDVLGRIKLWKSWLHGEHHS